MSLTVIYQSEGTPSSNENVITVVTDSLGMLYTMQERIIGFI